MRTSVIINTLNRCASLRATLDALTFQDHDDFEVIVVNGPSTDDTEVLLSQWAPRIKHLRCRVANLSMSRNIGVRAASGELVAFIDDDAIPERHWLTELQVAYEDDEVAAAGGVVFDHTGLSYQFEFGVADRYGDTALTSTSPDARALCVPGSWSYPSLLGTNTSFRRSALAQVGLFDETYEYYLDETDVLVRLVDAGYVVMPVDGAPVHHHFLPSHVRNTAKTITHWYPIVKNRTYFALRHARNHRTVAEIIQGAIDSANQRLAECQWAESNGLVPSGSLEAARASVDRGIMDGIRLAADKGTEAIPQWAEREPHSFLRFTTRARRSQRRIALITSSYPPAQPAGISRFMSELAPALAESGVDVRVITRADDHASVAWEDGIWVHRVSAHGSGTVEGTFPHVDAFATAVVHEIGRLQPRVPVDAAFSGAWDVEPIGLVRQGTPPVTIMLATPAAVAADEGQWWDDVNTRGPLNSLIECERELFRSASQVHAISNAIVETIEAHYSDGRPVFDADKVKVIPLGMADRAHGIKQHDAPASLVAFIGRLERRKGIDLFLDAMSELLPRYPQLSAVVAGTDPSGSGQAGIIERWAAGHEASVAERLIHHDRPSDDEIHRVYASADVVVLPSRYESFGLVVVEAMMHGAAIVSSDVGGISEIVRSGLDGLLVQPGDADALAGAIETLVLDDELRRTLGTSSRARFDSMFRIERCAEQLLDYLESSCTSPPRSGH